MRPLDVLICGALIGFAVGTFVSELDHMQRRNACKLRELEAEVEALMHKPEPAPSPN